MSETKTEEIPKSPELSFEVPRGFLLQEVKEGPLFQLDKIVMRELSGNEEDIIADEDTPIGQRLHQVVMGCVKSVSDSNGHTVDNPKHIKKMFEIHPNGFLMCDSLLMLFKLSEVTVGDEHRQTIACDTCFDRDDAGKKIPYKWTAVLSKKQLKVVKCKGDPLEYRRTFTTSRGSVVEWEMLSSTREEMFSEIDDTKDKLTTPLLMRVVKIDGESLKTDTKEALKVSKQILKDLPFMERKEIREQFDQEGGVDTEIEIDCPRCKKTLKRGLEMGPRDFFTPSAP
jgi:hypothetical protein